MNAPARRLLIVSSRFPFGSQEAYLGTELTELVKYFDRIAVVPLRPPTSAAVHRVPPGVEVLAWPLVNAALLRRAFQAFAARPRQALSAVFQILRSRDPGRAKNFAVIVKALALAQWTMEQHFDHIHAYWISAPATVACIAAAVSGVPWSSTAHRWDIYERNAFDVKERSASFVRTISARGTADIGTRMPTLARVLELGLGTNVPGEPAPLRNLTRTFHIICPAALVPIKGHADLLSAVALLRSEGVPIFCTIAGNGPLRESLEARVAALHLEDAVEFTGHVPQHTLHQWYRAGHFAAVTLASLADGENMEGVPSALIEAMAFGVSAVATNSGSIGEILDERCGHLVQAGDPLALARALRDVYADPAQAQVRAQRAYARIAQRHDVRQQMATLATMFSNQRSLS
ncbi:MAG TPA: glycosyltransferase [Candidatus Baltobacteraceae bacterium]|jgi:glycosyltransferase involved in cell wall biosynthesis|nr:glycosyltransferase [Candidatus Baltobacteraceae bacterium]